jgi:integrase
MTGECPASCFAASSAEELPIRPRAGRAPDSNGIQQDVAARCEERETGRAALPRLRFHDCRHFFGSLLLAFGETVLYVSRQLGHSSAKLTLDTYGHLVEEGHRLDRYVTLHKLEEAMHGAVRGRGGRGCEPGNP